MRLIDAEAIVKELLSLEWLGCDGGYYKGVADERDATIQRIAEAPTVDAVEVAEWTTKRTLEHDGELYCTACGKCPTERLDADLWSAFTPPYCPNCGAKMDKAVEG